MSKEDRDASERKIVEARARRDFQEAAGLVVEAYGPQVLGYLVRTMRSQADASEVFSQFCEDVCRGLPRFEGRSSFWTWTYRVATNARTRFWQDPYRRRGKRLPSGDLARIEQEVRSKTLNYLRTEVKDRFATLREKLSADEQSLLTLRVDKDMSWTEIAEVMSEDKEPCSDADLKVRATALRQRYQRLKDKIRKLAQEEGLMNGNRSDVSNA